MHRGAPEQQGQPLSYHLPRQLHSQQQQQQQRGALTAYCSLASQPANPSSSGLESSDAHRRSSSESCTTAEFRVERTPALHRSAFPALLAEEDEAGFYPLRAAMQPSQPQHSQLEHCSSLLRPSAQILMPRWASACSRAATHSFDGQFLGNQTPQLSAPLTPARSCLTWPGVSSHAVQQQHGVYSPRVCSAHVASSPRGQPAKQHMRSYSRAAAYSHIAKAGSRHAPYAARPPAAAYAIHSCSLAERYAHQEACLMGMTPGHADSLARPASAASASPGPQDSVCVRAPTRCYKSVHDQGASWAGSDTQQSAAANLKPPERPAAYMPYSPTDLMAARAAVRSSLHRSSCMLPSWGSAPASQPAVTASPVGASDRRARTCANAPDSFDSSLGVVPLARRLSSCQLADVPETIDTARMSPHCGQLPPVLRFEAAERHLPCHVAGSMELSKPHLQTLPVPLPDVELEADALVTPQSPQPRQCMLLLGDGPDEQLQPSSGEAFAGLKADGAVMPWESCPQSEEAPAARTTRAAAASSGGCSMEEIEADSRPGRAAGGGVAQTTAAAHEEPRGDEPSDDQPSTQPDSGGIGRNLRRRSVRQALHSRAPASQQQAVQQHGDKGGAGSRHGSPEHELPAGPPPGQPGSSAPRASRRTAAAPLKLKPLKLKRQPEPPGAKRSRRSAARHVAAETGTASEQEGAGSKDEEQNSLGASAGVGCPSSSTSKRLLHMDLDGLRDGGYLDMPIAEAAQALGVGLSTLKNCAHDVGITRWPFRSRQSLRVIIEQTTQYIKDNKLGVQGSEQEQQLLDALHAELQDVGTGRTPCLSSTIKRYRQWIFKLNHLQKKEPRMQVGVPQTILTAMAALKQPDLP